MPVKGLFKAEGNVEREDSRSQRARQPEQTENESKLRVIRNKTLGQKGCEDPALWKLALSRLTYLEAEAKAHESVDEGEGLQNALNSKAPVHKSPIRNLSNPRQNVRLTEDRQQE